MNLQALWLLLGFAWLGGCASPGANKAKASEEIQDGNKGIGRLLSKGQVDPAFRAAESLMKARTPKERELGTYWKAVCYLYRDQPDSAMAIFDAFQGRWTGGWREAHAQAFLSLAREANASRPVVRVRREEASSKSTQERSLLEKVEILQKETVDLRSEIARLETEKKKYEKLIKDLETIR